MSSNTREQEDWVSAFFQTADRCNADLTAEWFAEDIDMRFANHPPVGSRAAAREGLRQFMSNISGMVHVRESRVMEGNSCVQMATVRYTLPDGREVPLPVASHLRRNGDKLLDRLWIYIDLAPLFTP
jgi:predicted PhzF superfamily epimerase YddE/YHI9